MLDQLRESALMRRLTGLAAEIVRDTDPGDPIKRRAHELSRELHPHEEYVRICLLSLGELLTVCDQMIYAVEFLSGFKSRKRETIQITRLDSIVYHIESHLIRVTMVADRSLQLVNIMFRLGLPERECRMSTVAKNQHVLRTPVAESLKFLDKLLKPYREQRNIVVHRKGHSDEVLDGVAVYYLLQKSNQSGADREVTTRYFHLYKRMTDRLVQRKQQELSAINEQVFTALESLFADLKPVFEWAYLLQSANKVVRADV